MGVVRESQAFGTLKKQGSRCVLKDKKILVSDESRHAGYAVVQILTVAEWSSDSVWRAASRGSGHWLSLTGSANRSFD